MKRNGLVGYCPDHLVAPLLSIKKVIIMTRKLIAAFVLGSSLVLAACNTVEGAGKDVQSAGSAVEKAAN